MSDFRILHRLKAAATARRSLTIPDGWLDRRRLLCLSLVLALLVTAPTAMPGIVLDSVHYLNAAARFDSRGEFGSDYTWWPPLYPSLLLVFLKLAPLSQAGWLNYLLLAAFMFLCLQLLRLLQLGFWTTLLAAVAIALSYPARFVFVTLWSETLGLPLLVGWLLYWSLYLHHPSRRRLALACLFFGLCSLTRHWLVPMLGTMLASLLLTWSRTRQRPLAPLTAIALATVPYAGWLLRTWLVSGTLTGPRPPQFMSLGLVVKGPLEVATHWLLPGVYLPGLDPLAILVSIVLLVVPAVLTVIALRRESGAAAAATAPGAAGALACTSLLFMGSYLVFMFAASLGSCTEQPRERYMAPVFVPLVILILFGLTRSGLCVRGTVAAKLLAATGGVWLLAESLLP